METTMLSNPPTNTSALQMHQRLHRRQKSTPTAHDTLKMRPNPSSSPAPAAATRKQLQQQQQSSPSAQTQQRQQQPPARQMSHRRGLSLDTRRQQLQQRQHRHQQMQQQLHSQQQQQQLMTAAAATAASAPALTTTDNDNHIQQDYSNTVSSTTNPGLSTTQQHIMRETQQQRAARPGATSTPFAKQSHEEVFVLSPQGTTTMMASGAQPFDMAGPGAGGPGDVGAAPAGQQPQQQDCTAVPFDYYNGPAAVMMRKALSGSGLPVAQQDFQLFANPDQNGLSTNAFMTFQDAADASSPQGWVSEDDTVSTRRTARRISNGIMDRVVKFESMTMDGLPRPATPPRQNDEAYFPPTPTGTPQQQLASQAGGARLSRFADDYDESMEETIKPSRNNRSNRSSGIFEAMRQQAEAAAAMNTPPPPPSAMMQVPMTPADFMNMNNVNAEFMKIQNANYMSVPTEMQHLSPPLSQHATPATMQGMFDQPDLWQAGYDAQAAMASFSAPPPQPTDAASPTHSEASLTLSRRRSPHHRDESFASIASMASAASIASINIEETRTQTGVTLDDIATYIDGPSPVDGKWRCTYENCDKRFGRKENIKSHVQTHLNDRQYQCPHCQKCFVRQHDLKRHAKIHTGIKPYPCECGNHFARHDALTRHRQRGMCIGAFDGAVRKVGKRGRPRKARPNLDARREKSSRTRSKNHSSTGIASTAAMDGCALPSSPEASSQSGYSDSSAVNSPHTDESDYPFDDEPFDPLTDSELLDIGFGLDTGVASHRVDTATMNPSALAVSSAPMPGAGISAEEMVRIMPVVSPSEHAAAMAATGAASPSAMSHHSHVSHVSVPNSETVVTGHVETDELPAHHPASPAKSVASHYTQHPSTPPELSASSSPPHSSARYFDLGDPNSSCTEDDSFGLSAPLTGGCGALGGMNMEAGSLSSGSLDDDIMLMKSFSGDDVLVQLDNSGLSMLNTSRFEDEYGMFTNSDDVFFGNN